MLSPSCRTCSLCGASAPPATTPAAQALTFEHGAVEVLVDGQLPVQLEHLTLLLHGGDGAGEDAERETAYHRDSSVNIIINSLKNSK